MTVASPWVLTAVVLAVVLCASASIRLAVHRRGAPPSNGDQPDCTARATEEAA